MSSVSSIAASGIAATTVRLQTLSANIANAATSASLPDSKNSAAAKPAADMASQIVQMIMARLGFVANIQVMKTDARMTRTLFDIKA